MGHIRLFDNHIHTAHSHDSTCPMQEQLEAASRMGLAGVAITEHCDIEYGTRDFDCIRASYAEVQALKQVYADQLQVLAGIELGEPIWDMPLAQFILDELNFDVVIGSVHAAIFEGATEPYSHIDFSKWDNARIDAYLHQYFCDVYKTVETVDFDILAHLTCPLRYIVKKEGYRFDLAKFEEQIEEILRLLIQKGRTLEVNTSGCRGVLSATMPDEAILLKYRALGGERISLGSDAHTSKDTGSHLEQTIEVLRRCGFTHTVYYRERVCHQIEIGE